MGMTLFPFVILFINTQLVKHTLPGRVHLTGLLQCSRDVHTKKLLWLVNDPQELAI